MEEVLRQYKDLLIQKRYSKNTQYIYYSYFKDFCVYFREKGFKNITTVKINSYILNFIKSKNISISQQNQRRMVFKINGAKGKKDRRFLLTGNFLQLLRQYYKEYNLKEYLFEGQNGGKYSESSIDNIIKKSALCLRELLDYKNSKTTEIYTHVSKKAISNIKNPIDDFFE